MLRVGARTGLLLLLAGAGPVDLWAQSPAQSVSFGGQLRFRGEWDGRNTGVGDDAAVLSRIRLGAAATATPWLTAYIQLQDARAWGTELDPVEGTADQLDLHQGYLDLTRREWTLRLGRQEMGLGDERLVGPLSWANTGRSFDGVLVRRTWERGHFRGFWMNIHERDALTPTGVAPQANQGLDDDGWLWGGFLTQRVGASSLELIFLHDRNAATDESNTAHGRWFGRTGSIVYDASAAYQFGPDRSAFLMSGMVGLAVGQGGLLAGQVDYISGDGNPLDAERGAFQTLYPTAHAYHGYMDYFLVFPTSTRSAGLIDAMARVRAPVAQPWRVRGDLHYFATAQPLTNRRRLGAEVDVVLGRTLAPGAGVELGMSGYAPSDLMGAVAPAFALGADTPTYWGYLMLTVDFVQR